MNYPNPMAELNHESALTYKAARDQLIMNIRLDFDPVGIRFVFDEDEIEKLPVTHKAKAKITYCQFLAAVRQERFALFMEPKKLLCEKSRFFKNTYNYVFFVRNEPVNLYHGTIPI